MIKFKTVKDDGGKIVRLEVKGHSGYAEEGSDIVCAAASAACQMAVMGIESQGLAEVQYETGDGILVCDISPERKDGADVLLESLVYFMCELSKQYGKYISILEV